MIDRIFTELTLTKNNEHYLISVNRKDKTLLKFKVEFNEPLKFSNVTIRSEINLNSINSKDFLIRESVRNIKKKFNLTIHKIATI